MSAEACVRTCNFAATTLPIPAGRTPCQGPGRGKLDAGSRCRAAPWAADLQRCPASVEVLYLTRPRSSPTKGTKHDR
jgi:hypothetical protein